MQVEKYHLKLHHGIQQNLRRGKKENLYRADVDEILVSDLRLEQLVNVLKPELNRQITGLYLRSLATENGKKLLHRYLKNDSSTNASGFAG